MGNTSYPPIRNFTDACMEAFAMRERFPYVHASLLLTEEGDVLTGIAFTLRRVHTHQTAIDWTTAMAKNGEPPPRVLFISTAKNPTRIVERDIARFEATRAAFADLGVEVVDWIKVNHDAVRSMAMTCGVESWADLGPLGEAYIRLEP